MSRKLKKGVNWEWFTKFIDKIKNLTEPRLFCAKKCNSSIYCKVLTLSSSSMYSLPRTSLRDSGPTLQYDSSGHSTPRVKHLSWLAPATAYLTNSENSGPTKCNSNRLLKPCCKLLKSKSFSTLMRLYGLIDLLAIRRESLVRFGHNSLVSFIKLYLKTRTS